MSPIAKIVWSAVVLVVAVAALVSQVVTWRQTGVRYLEHTTNADELTRDVLVGQTFTGTKDNLSALSVMFATYSGRENRGEIHLHVRSSIYDREDIRRITITPDQVGDNQLYRFEFEPIPDSEGKQFFFFVVAPDAVPDSAVTIDLNTQDPYHLGSAYIVRGQGSNVTDPAILELSGKPTTDVVFGTAYSVPVREAIVDGVIGSYKTFVGTWDQKRSIYMIWAQAVIPAALFFVMLFVVRESVYSRIMGRMSKRQFTMGMLTLLFIAALITRYLYARELPFTNDEGNYLYDAYAARQGVLAGGDGYVKAPLVIAWVALWQMLLNDHLLAGRIASIVIGALTLFPLYFLAKDLWSSKAITKAWVPLYLTSASGEKKQIDNDWGRRVGIIVATMWAFFGAPIVSNIYVHTQPVALFFGISGLAVLLMSLRGTTPRLTFITTKTVPSATGWFILAGILLGLGVASRKSMLALGLIPILFIVLESKNLKNIGKHFLAVGVGFLLVITLFLGGAWYAYGEEGVWEAIGVNSAEDGIATDEDVTPDQIRAYSLRGMTPFFRESLPLILLSILGMGVTLEQLIRSMLRWLEHTKAGLVNVWVEQLVPKLGWIAAWAVFMWAWNFFFEYEGAAFIDQYGIGWLWHAFAGLLVLLTVLPRSKGEAIVQKQPEVQPVVAASTQPGGIKSHAQSEDIQMLKEKQMSVRWHITAALVIPLWVGGLAFFYMNWIKFHSNYIAEFIPPLVALSAYGMMVLYHRLQPRLFLAKDYPVAEILRRIGVLVVFAIIFWAIVVSNYITFFFEHTGTFTQGSVKEAIVWARDNIPHDEPIFTGAAMIPYLSGHRVALDIAHPRWYAYGFTRNDPQRLNTFLPPAEEMVQAYRDSEWLLLEGQTGFSFLMEYSEIEAGIERDWVAIQGIENGSNTLTFYRRVR
ncbi:MAG: hypothetical protein WEC84_04925 [Candidatus Andersenbacteria bacterium]